MHVSCVHVYACKHVYVFINIIYIYVQLSKDFTNMYMHTYKHMQMHILAKPIDTRTQV